MEFYFSGTKFKLIDSLDMSHTPKAECYLLAETFEPEYVFQIICITGYHTGKLVGYIKKDPLAEEPRVTGITFAHLMEEIQRNFQFEEGSLEVLTVPD